MLNILKNQKEMNIIGQGGKIIMFTLPSLIAAILVHIYLPHLAALPEIIIFIKPLGYLLLLLGLIFWGTALIQLIMDFPKGKLVTMGAYGVVRNPLYSSYIFFVLPGIALITLTWVYFVVSVFLYIGVMIFIRKEEEQLAKVFGKEYEDYLLRVDRMVPFAGAGQEQNMGRKVLLVCGILASLVLVVSDIIAAIQWEAYSYTDQSVSELRAIGAPTRSLLVPLLAIYAGLEIAFGLGVRGAAGRKNTIRTTGVLMICLGIIDMAALFTPMNVRGAESTLTDIIHIIFTIVTVILFLLILGFGAVSGTRWFRYYSFATIFILILFGVWAFLDAPNIAANLPTPWIGVRERINIYAYMLWMAVLAIALLRTEKQSGTIGSGKA